MNGVRIVRSGRQWTVHLKAFQRYRGRLRRDFDLVIDEINTMPFFTPLWAGIPTLTLIFQLARDVWWYESKFPMSALGFLAECFYLIPYRKTNTVTISRSTESDLRNRRFRGVIAVIPIGVEPGAATQRNDSSIPLLLYVGRLAPSKRVDHVVRAFAIFRQAVGAGRLHIVGGGDSRYTDSLRRLVDKLALHEDVTFAGRLPKVDRNRLMSEADALLMASVREGWGLVVTEANSYGTPAIVYDVPGLRDSVRHEQTGLVVGRSPQAMADGMVRLWTDATLRARLGDAARTWSQSLTFEAAFQAMLRETVRAIGVGSALEPAAQLPRGLRP
jgi:glycosyltransferase involved in cell wall biosynthesis